MSIDQKDISEEYTSLSSEKVIDKTNIETENLKSSDEGKTEQDKKTRNKTSGDRRENVKNEDKETASLKKH